VGGRTRSGQKRREGDPIRASARLLDQGPRAERLSGAPGHSDEGFDPSPVCRFLPRGQSAGSPQTKRSLQRGFLDLAVFLFGFSRFDGGRTRARTLDPLIKNSGLQRGRATAILLFVRS
jgi:hypothetical protein